MTNTITISGPLDGKVASINGGGRGIGAAASHLVAREGARVVLAARSETELEAVTSAIRAEGGDAAWVRCGLADPESVRAAVDRLLDLHGRLDVAFNNGAATQQPGPLEGTPHDEMDHVYRVNFRGQWLAMQAEADAMRRTGSGAMVNTSSIGSRRANSALPAYGAIERALNSLTAAWVPFGIRVNGVTPGGTRTEMSDAWKSQTRGSPTAQARRRRSAGWESRRRWRGPPPGYSATEHRS